MSRRFGPVILVGGSEFMPGNEPHDRLFVEAAARRPIHVIATAAVRQDPDRAVRTARRWFAGLGAEASELRLRGRRDAAEPSTVRAAREGGGFYLCGGDPGLVIRLLAGTPAWAAILEAWRDGAVIAGSSAGAMALGEWSLIRSGMSHARRRFAAALGIVPRLAVVPHFEEFGEGWLPSIAEEGRRATLLGLDTRTAAAWRPGLGWRALGAGRIIVISGGARSHYRSGGRVLRLPRPKSPSRPRAER